MCRLHSLVVILAIELLYFNFVAGYKWVHVKPGNRLPSNAHILSPGLGTYQGRARHYEEILPAEVHNSSYAVVYSCSELIIKRDFQVLVDTEDCTGELFDFRNIPRNIVLGGQMDNGEPIYLGWANDPNYSYSASILLTSNQVIKWKDADRETYALVCKDPNEWVDSWTEKMPRDPVSGGKSADNNAIYVARLKKRCNVIPGMAIPDLGIAIGELNGEAVQAQYCQVLVEGTNSYSWVWATNGKIPDYAVVAAKSYNGELMYVARMNNTLSYIVYSEALRNQLSYEVLVMDQE